MTPARDIATDRAERAHKLAGSEAGTGRCAPRCRQLAMSKVSNLRGSGSQRRSKRGIDGLPGGGHLFRSHAQMRLIFEAVELGRKAQQGPIASISHSSHDALYGGLNGIERRASTPFQRGNHRGRLARASSFGSDQLHRSFVSFRGATIRPCSADTRQCRRLWLPSIAESHRAPRALRRWCSPPPIPNCSVAKPLEN